MRFMSRALVFAVFLGLGAAQATAASIFLEVDGIPGDSDDKNYKDAIEVATVSIGVSEPSEGDAGGTRRRGASVLSDLVVTTTGVNVASPSLWLAVNVGQVIPQVKLAILNTFSFGDKPIVEFELKNARVVDYLLHPADDGSLVDTVAFNYEEIKYTYISYDESGKGTSTSASWKEETGKLLAVPPLLFTASETTVPEPSSFVLAIVAASGLIVFRVQRE